MRSVRFGISISLSGKYEVQGEESFEGLLLWVQEVNKSGGIFVGEVERKVPVDFIYYDDQSSEDKCKNLIERLIVQDKVDILIGPYSSGLTLAAATVAERHEKILWNHGGSTDEIYNKGPEYIVNAIAPASRYFTGLIKMVRETDPGAKKLAILRAEDSGFCSNVAEGAGHSATENSFDTVEFKYLSGVRNWDQVLRELNEFHPDIIIGAGRMEDDLDLAKQIIERGVEARAIGFIAAGIKEFQKILGNDAEGFLGPSQWEKGVKIKGEFGPTPEEFSHKFKSKYGKEPDYTAAQSYNIGLIIQRCIKEAETLNDSMLKTIARRSDFKTFYGHFKIEPISGKQVGQNILTVQWQGGHKFIVYPEEASEARLEYPRAVTLS